MSKWEERLATFGFYALCVFIFFMLLRGILWMFNIQFAERVF